MSDYKPHFAEEDSSKKNNYKPSTTNDSVGSDNYQPHFSSGSDRKLNPTEEKVVKIILNKYATDPEFKRQWDEERGHRYVQEETPSKFNEGYRIAKTMFNRYANPLNLVRDARKVYNQGSEVVAKEIYDEANKPEDEGVFSKGVRDSTLGMADDIMSGRRGGSGYTPGEKAWTRKVFTEKEALKQTWDDIKYLTGQGIADLPVIGALGFTVGRMPGIGIGTTFGSKSGIDEALREYRDTGEVSRKKVAREAVKGFGTGLVLAGAGAGANRLVKGIANKFVPELYKTERLLRNTNRLAKAADYVAGGTGMTVAGAALNDQDVELRDIARNVLGGIAIDAGRVAGIRNAENKMDAMLDNDSVKSEYVKLIEQSTNEKFNAYEKASRKYIKEVKLPKELRTPDNIAKKAVEKAVDDYYRVKKNLKDIDESKLSAKEKEMFLDPQAEADYLRGTIKAIEARTKGKSGYLGEDGTIIRPLETVSSIKDIDAEIARIIEEENARPVDTYEAVANVARRTDDLVKAREHARNVDDNAIAFMKKSHGLSRRIRDTEAYLYEMFGKDSVNNHERAAVRRILLNDELQGRLSRRVNAPTKMGVISKWLETDPYIIKTQLGEAGAQYIYEPKRAIDSLFRAEQERYTKEINDIAKNFNEQERKEIQAYRKMQRHRTDDNNNDVHIGPKLIERAIERGELKPSDVKTWDELSQKQRDAITYMNLSEKASLDRFNAMKRATGEEELRESKGFSPVVYEKQMEYGDNTNVHLREYKKLSTDTSHSKKMEGANLKLADEFEGHLLYKNAMERAAYAGATAKRMEEFAEKIKIINPEGAEAVKGLAKYWSGDFTDPTPAKKFIHELNKRQYASFLSNSLGTILNQGTALKLTLTEIGSKHTVRALESWYESKFNDAEHLRNERHMQDSSVLKGALHDSVAEDYNSVVPAGKIKRGSEWLSFKGSWTFKQVDMYCREITRQAAYNKYKEMGYNSHDARYKADDIVMKTQGSGARGETSKIHKTAFGKLLFSFTTFRFSQLNYMAHEMFGVHPMKKNMRVFLDFEKAKEFAKSNKEYGIETVRQTGLNSKTRYVVYHKQRTANTVSAMQKIILFSMFSAVSSTVFDMIGDSIGIKIFHDPAPVDEGMKKILGYKTSDVVSDYIFGTNRKEESKKDLRKYTIKDGKRKKITKGARYIDAGVAALRETAGFVPVLGEVARGTTPAGSVIGTLGRIGVDIDRLAKNKKWEDAVKLANDTSTILIGNGLYQPTKHALQIKKNYEDKHKSKSKTVNTNPIERRIKNKFSNIEGRIEKKIKNRFN